MNTDPQELRTRAIALVNRQSTMTLATAGDNSAWAAPIYYVLYKAKFYFFSDPNSRHIQEGLSNDQVAGAIYPFADTWQDIRGLQMSGRIRNVGPGYTGLQAVLAYLKKFPFTKDFFEPGQIPDLASFTDRFRVKLYRFEPQVIYYLDNRIRFGFRAEIKL